MILGWLMLAASLGAACFGMPRMIAANWRARSVPRGSAHFLLWALAAYSLRLAWTAVQGDWLTAAAALPGVIATGILVVQQVIYGGSE